MKVEVTVTAAGQAVQGLARRSTRPNPGRPWQPSKSRSKACRWARPRRSKCTSSRCPARPTSKTTRRRYLAIFERRPASQRRRRPPGRDLIAPAPAANLWRAWHASITDTQGIIAIAAAAVAVLALLGVRDAGAERAPPARAPSGVVLGEHGERDLVAHAAELQDAFEALRDYVGDSAARLDARLGGVEAALRGRDRPPRAGALRRLQRALRAAVDVDRAARRRRIGDRAVLHPPPRPGARVRQAGARRARRARALARGGGGGAPGAESGRQRTSGPMSPRSTPAERHDRASARASAISDRRAPSARRRCWRARAPDAVEPVALATIYDTVMALARGEVSGRSCRSRTRSRARSA